VTACDLEKSFNFDITVELTIKPRAFFDSRVSFSAILTRIAYILSPIDCAFSGVFRVGRLRLDVVITYVANLKSPSPPVMKI